MMVGKPGEGKPRHYLSLDLPVVPDMEWRGLPSPGSTTASSRLLHVFERYWPQAARSPEELRTFLNNELKLCQINHLFLDRILLQLVTRICHQQALSGSGKTTLAEVIARQTHTHFVTLSAVSAGVADLRKVVEDARKLRQFTKQRTIMFIDEIHRFNKAQQDAVLPHVERGVVTLIGATTENPSFEVNAALLSRCRVFTLRALTEEQILSILRHALEDKERGLGQLAITIDDDALHQIAVFANGDARTALNVLELAAQGGGEASGENTPIHITLSTHA